jgi:hypothetical protein
LLALAFGAGGMTGCATPGTPPAAQSEKLAAPEQGTAAQDQLAGVPNFYNARSTNTPGSGAYAGGEATAEPAPVPPPPAPTAIELVPVEVVPNPNVAPPALPSSAPPPERAKCDDQTQAPSPQMTAPMTPTP